jgi:hypothetical protein
MHGDHGFASDAARGEEVCVAEFIVVIPKVAHLHQTFVYKGVQTVIDLA